ncbi:MAG TPA: hypothetical protein VGX68_21450 [Thermoanaerobaculia bacterium]|nr:hypothetical protein [Thermoanaerobaculia bacterium]
MLAVLFHWRGYQWIAMALLILGFSEMEWWTSPSFFGGAQQEFTRLIENKIWGRRFQMIASWLLLAALNCPPPQSSQLVGLWESESKSKGGIGHAFEFRSDGSFVVSPTVLVDSYYRISGDQVIMGDKPNPEPGDHAKSLPLMIEGNRRGNGERVGSPVPGQPPLVGVWRTPFPPAAMAYEKYTPDGRWLFRLPMRPEKGCYGFDGAKLTFAINGKQESGSAELRGDNLSLKFPNRGVDKYHRDPTGAWYPLEPPK